MQDKTMLNNMQEFDLFLKELVGIIEEEQGQGQSTYLRFESFYAQSSVYNSFYKMANELNNKNPHVLEFGYGMGLLSLSLAKMGCKVTAIDFSRPKNIVGIMKRANVENEINFLELNLENQCYDLKENYYDAVFAVDCLEHIKNVRAVFENAHQCLKPGGLFYIHTPNYGRLNVRMKSFINIFRPNWPISLDSYVQENPYRGHIREFTATELVKLFNFFGFEVVAQEFPPSIGWGREWRYDRGLVKLAIQLSWQLQEIARRVSPPLGACQLVVGKKL